MTKEYIREVNKYENTKEKQKQDLVNLQGWFHKHRHYLNIFNYSTIVFKFLTKVLNTSRYQSVSQILYRILKYLKWYNAYNIITYIDHIANILPLSY